MRQIRVFLLCIILVLGFVHPCAAVEASSENVIFYEEKTNEDGITTITVITSHGDQARSTNKTYTKKSTSIKNGTIIADIWITGTFQYDGTTVSVVSKSISKCETYDGWSFKQSSFTSSGGTITLEGKLTKLIVLNADISISLSCDKNGNIS